MTRTKPVNPPRAITPPGGPSRGRKAYRYSIVESLVCLPSGETVRRFSIRRALPDAAITQCWKGREMGWMPDTATTIPKLYAQYGHAYRTLRKLQGIDAEVMIAAGRRRRLERLAPELLDALRGVMQYTGGWDADPPHPCGKARDVLARADRILNLN